MNHLEFKSKTNHAKFTRLIFASIAIVIVIAIPSYDEGCLRILAEGLSMHVSESFPQLVALTKNREYPYKALVLVISIIALSPIQFIYLILKLDSNEIRKKYLNSKPLLNLAHLFLAFGMSVVVVIIVFHIPIDIGTPPGRRIGRTLYPLLGNELGYGIFVLILITTMIYLFATTVSALWMVLNNKEEGK